MTWAAVRVRGQVHLSADTRDTLRLLRLTRANHCVLLVETDANRGMLQKVKDHITWGEVTLQTVENLLAARGLAHGRKRLVDAHLQGSKFKHVKEFAAAIAAGQAKLGDVPAVIPVLRLPPPRQGFEGSKRAFAAGGALGYRGQDINDLLARMLSSGDHPW